jgi:hypothetical protein
MMIYQSSHLDVWLDFGWIYMGLECSGLNL